MIIVERKCPFTGQMNTMEIPLTQEEYDRGFSKWENGAYIQAAFPTLNAEQREFVKTGITPQKWTEIFGEDAR